MTWTRFMDMYSGGGSKERWGYIFIEAAEEEAVVIFYNRFGHNPNRVTCTCCGPDYSMSEDDSLEQATAFERNCAFVYFRPDGSECSKEEGFIPCKGMPEGYSSKYVERQGTYLSHGDYIPLSTYLEKPEVLVIKSIDILPEERSGEVPEQGYVWVD